MPLSKELFSVAHIVLYTSEPDIQSMFHSVYVICSNNFQHALAKHFAKTGQNISDQSGNIP